MPAAQRAAHRQSVHVAILREPGPEEFGLAETRHLRPLCRFHAAPFHLNGTTPLMALPRYRRAAGADQEVEVAAGVGLGHVLGVELGPAVGQAIRISARRPARETARCGSPGSF